MPAKTKKQNRMRLSDLPKPKITENAKIILQKRYLEKNPAGKTIEDPTSLFWRVAENVAQADKIYDENADVLKTAKNFYSLLANLEFMPNSPTLMNAGRKLQQLSACFVLPIEDSMEGIFETLKDTAMIHKSGGGTGFSFSRLRPKNSIVGTTSGIASGPISFMKIFDAATEQIKQGGTRRGANMAILRADHPDIEEFINCKADMTSINNFNISVAATEKFMEAVEKDKDFKLIDPKTKNIVQKIKAKKLFDEIVDNAWKNGDPGLIFIDRANEKNPTKAVTEIEATNPCGEQPLPPYGSCNLGSINLVKMVSNSQLDWEKLKKTVHNCVHFLDNVIDMNNFPIPEIGELARNERRIGLGVMGFADLLILLGIQYDSKEALGLAEKLMKFIYQEAAKKSQEFGKERGNFPFFDKSTYPQKNIKFMRNAALLTVAPTGTISIISDCSSGIEPIYAISFYRFQADTKMVDVNKVFSKIAKKKGFYSKKLFEQIAESGSLANLEEVPEDVKKIFHTAHDIFPEWHIKMQAAFQKYVDSSISKTINFPNSATREEVAKSYLLAYKLGCKGITIYRDGSREAQVLSTGKTQKYQEDQGKSQSSAKSPRSRPTIMRGTTYKVRTSYGNLYITINDDDENLPFEVFTQMGKAGGFFAAKLEAISRLISLALRSGVEIREIIDQLKGIRDPMPTWSEGGMILSLPDGIAQILEKHITRGQQKLNLDYPDKKTMVNSDANSDAPKASIADLGVAPACPDCGAMLEIGEGCLKCQSCGYSKCG